MSTLNLNIPPNATKEQYDRMKTGWKELNKFGQAYVTESTWQKIKDGGESIFNPIEEAEESVIDGVVTFLHTTQGIVVMLILLIALIMICGICYFCKGCIHECSVRRRLEGMSFNNAQLQQSRPLNETVTDTAV